MLRWELYQGDTAKLHMVVSSLWKYQLAEEVGCSDAEATAWTVFCDFQLSCNSELFFFIIIPPPPPHGNGSVNVMRTCSRNVVSEGVIGGETATIELSSG